MATMMTIGDKSVVCGAFVALLPTIHAIVVGSIVGAMMIGVDPVVSGESVSSVPVVLLDGTGLCTRPPTKAVVDGAIRKGNESSIG